MFENQSFIATQLSVPCQESTTNKYKHYKSKSGNTKKPPQSEQHCNRLWSSLPAAYDVIEVVDWDVESTVPLTVGFGVAQFLRSQNVGVAVPEYEERLNGSLSGSVYRMHM